MKRFPRFHMRRPVALFGFVAVVFALTACGGRENEPVGEQERAGAESQVVAAAHKHEKRGETCFICDPDKREKGRLWCREHGRYEDRCWLCHPELEDKSRLYCKEHFLYEDECFLCHPELKQKPTSEVEIEHDPFVASSTAPGLFCNEHSVPEMECGICQPQLASTLQPGKSLLVRMPSAASTDKAGIRIGRPQPKEIAPALQALCETQYNQNALAKITPLAGGIVHRVYADVGDPVEAGDVLVELHAAEAAAAKSAYLSALVAFEIKKETRDREKRLVEESISAKKDYLEAEADFRTAGLAVRNARQKLLNLGLSAGAVSEIERTEEASAFIEIRAPFNGTLIDRSAVPGQAVAPGDVLFALADLSTRWLILSIPADRSAGVQVGQPVNAQFDELPGETVAGKIVWVDTAIDARTRLVRARVLVTENVDRIKVGMFGRAQVLTDRARPGLIVPQDAVQHHERHPFVFVKHEPDLYALRRVELGAASEGHVEILAGLQPDEMIVSDAGFMVMSEFLKSRLGAGCVDH